MSGRDRGSEKVNKLHRRRPRRPPARRLNANGLLLSLTCSMKGVFHKMGFLELRVSETTYLRFSEKARVSELELV